MSALKDTSLQDLPKTIRHSLYHLTQTESGISTTLAIIIGILTGLIISAYDIILKFLQDQIWSGSQDYPFYYIIAIPAIGGLIVGLIARMSHNTNRCDVAEVIEATALHGGRIKIRNSFEEVFLSIISIATGGSVGKEAPGVLAGAGVGSMVAKIFKTPDNRFRVLLGCGASGGIAAAFNAPLAGVVFVVEVILGELETKTFIPIVISAVFATLVSNLLFGVEPIHVSHYSLVDPIRESFLYLILGLLSGIISVFFIRSLFITKDLFAGLEVPSMLKPAIGGLLVGIIALYNPYILGMGYEVITMALENQFSLKLLITLMVLKIIAYSLIVGAGGSGGSIIPSMFIGSMLGGAFGTIVHSLFPAFTAQPGAYALVGMGGVFAGTARAPLTSMLIIFELTRDYNLILPLMLTCVLSNVIASAMYEESIFTEQLKRRGFVIRKGKEINVMESMLVKNNMIKDVQTISKGQTAADLLELMQKSRHAGFPVMDEEGKLYGIVTLEDMREKVEYGKLDQTVEKLASTSLIVAYPDENLDLVLKRLAIKDIGRLPVVSRDDSTLLLGMITRSDVVKSYNKKIVKTVQINDQRK